MDKLEQWRGVAVPLLRDNVDTDSIIPSREMRRVSRLGLGEGLFAGWRYLEASDDVRGDSGQKMPSGGTPAETTEGHRGKPNINTQADTPQPSPDQAVARRLNPDFVLNQPQYRGASILLSGANFGCGSSREHAVWALREYGFRVIIASGFGSIFANNCVRNGILPLVLGAEDVQALAAWVGQQPQANQVLVDLPAQEVRASGKVCRFDIQPADKRMLVQGLDEIALTQQSNAAIQALHEQRRKQFPWWY